MTIRKSYSFSTPHRRKYIPEALRNAVEAYRDGQGSLRMIEQRFGIHRSTIGRNYKVMLAGHIPPLGRPPLFTKAEEQVLRNSIFFNARSHMPMTVDDVITFAEEILEKERQDNGGIFTRPNIPHEWSRNDNGEIKLSRKWWNGFVRRNPDVRLRVPEALSMARSNVSETGIRKWFQAVQTSIAKLGAPADILNNPSRIFNLDEFGALLNPKSPRVLAVASMRSVSQTLQGNEMEQMTVVANCNATGDVVPEMYLLEKRKLTKKLSDILSKDDITVGSSENGWITVESLEHYISNHFGPWLREKNIQLPVLLFLDRHSSR